MGQHGMRAGTVSSLHPRASAVLLGNVVFYGVRRRGLPDEGLRFPSVLRKLCASRLRVVWGGLCRSKGLFCSGSDVRERARAVCFRVGRLGCRNSKVRGA